jgi:hypothetical protein
MSHAQRFDAVGAQKGTALHGVADALKRVASAVEKRFDPNSPEVVGAMQRFEQGLALLRTAPELPQEAADSDDSGEEQAGSDAPKATTRRKSTKKPDGEGEES